jgi:hypothetical protein
VRAGAGVRRRRRRGRAVRGARGGAAAPVVRGAAGDGGAGVRVQAGGRPPGPLRRPPFQGRPRRRLRLRLLAALQELIPKIITLALIGSPPLIKGGIGSGLRA